MEEREPLRLTFELPAQALDQAARLPGGDVTVLMHYPPLLPETLRTGTAFTRLMTQYGVARCVYGHLHGPSVQRGFSGVYEGVRYDLVSCDALGFQLKEIVLN